MCLKDSGQKLQFAINNKLYNPLMQMSNTMETPVLISNESFVFIINKFAVFFIFLIKGLA